MHGFTKVCANTPALLERIKELMATGQPRGLDCESDGPLLLKPQLTKAGKQSYDKFLNMDRSSLVGFSLAFENKESFYVPVNHRKKNAPYYEAMRIFQLAFEAPGTCAVHNLKHELKAANLEAIFPKPRQGLRCTQVGTWLAGMGVKKGDTEVYGLKELSKKHLGHEMSKFETVVGGTGGYFGMMDAESPEAVEYACEDAIGALMLDQICWPRIQELGLEHWHDAVEMPCVWVLRAMTDEGLRIDHERAQAIYEFAGDETRKHIAKFQRLFPGVSPASTTQLQALFEDGTWPKLGKKGKAGWSTHKAAVEAIAGAVPKGSVGEQATTHLLNMREVLKIQSTYSGSLIRLASQYLDNRLHPSFSQTGTATGRFSSSYPNGQNMPVRGQYGPMLMAMFAAPEDEIWGSADYSQIELRVLAHHAGGKLQEGYKLGQDVHQNTGTTLGTSRDTGKTVNFALIYGAAAGQLSRTIGCTKQEAQRYLDGVKSGMPAVGALFQRIYDAAYERGFVKTLGGRYRWLPDMPRRGPELARRGFKGIKYGDEEATKRLMRAWSDERKAGNTVCQGGAGDIVKKAMVDLHFNKPDWLKLNCQIHDDIRWAVKGVDPESEAGQARAKESLEIVSHYMENAWELRVPLVADGVLGRNWKELKYS